MDIPILNFFEDPGHGWLEVSLSLLKQMDINKKISSYSYFKNEFVYLEEDCDMSLFLNKLKELKLSEPEIVRRFSNHDSPVRNYKSYNEGSLFLYENSFKEEN